MPRASAGAAAFGAGAAPGLALSTSFKTIRPWGPEPRSAARSMPFCFATRLARGDAKMRLPPLASLREAVSPASGGEGSFLSSPFSGELVRGTGGGLDLISPTFSPSPRITAIGVLTKTSSVPSATRILPSVPSSTASTSMVALSVSISARMSPDLTLSPSFFSHLASLPFSMVGDKAGMRIWTGMELPLHLRNFGIVEWPQIGKWERRCLERNCLHDLPTGDSC